MGLKIGMGPSGREVNEFIDLPEGLMLNKLIKSNDSFSHEFVEGRYTGS
jgi:hypothetical protein